MEKLKKLDENNVYSLGDGRAVMTHLSNRPTGARNSCGQLKDNIQNEGWHIFEGEPGKMIPTKKLREEQALRLINSSWKKYKK